MALKDRQKELAGYFIAGFPDLELAPWSALGAYAVVGNATQENSCLPVTTGAKDHGSDGLMQWRQGRLTEMQSWCIAKFGDWKNNKAQAAFTMFETKRDYPVLDEELRAGVKSVATMATNFNRIFERSADNEEINNRRIKFAGDVQLAMSGAPSPKPPVVVAGAGGAAAVGASLWQYFSGAPIYISVAANIVLAAVAVFLAWKLYQHGDLHAKIITGGNMQPDPQAPPTPRHSAPPTPPVIADESLATLMARYTADLAVVAVDKAALAKKAAAVEDELTQAKEHLK